MRTLATASALREVAWAVPMTVLRTRESVPLARARCSARGVCLVRVRVRVRVWGWGWG